MQCPKCHSPYKIRYETPIAICYECPKCNCVEIFDNQVNYQDLSKLV